MAEVNQSGNSSIRIIRALSPEAMQRVVAIRREVFVVEQHVDPSEEYDAYESTCHHYLAYLNDRPVGAARHRLVAGTKLKLERIAVLKDARGHGVGAALVRHMLADAPKGLTIYMHAQTHALPFYERLGFVAEGERFYEAGIEHVAMVYLRGATANE